MKLSARISSFFLTALAIILISNSLLLFLVARSYLYRRFSEQLQSALDTLVAAVEVEDDDVKWEPTDHTVRLGLTSGVADTRWIVFNQDEKVIARSQNTLPPIREIDLLAAARSLSDNQDLGSWRILTHSLAAPHPKPVEERAPLEHAKLTVVVARNESELGTTLRWFGIALIVLPAACWLAAALAGRWYCEQAIAPLSAMVKSINEVKPEDTSARLHVPQSHDELETLGKAFNGLLDQVFLGYERQRRFSGDAAHQLRTPLTILLGQVEVALRKPRSTGEYEATLNIVNQEVLALRQTVEALLFLAKPDDDRSASEVQALDLETWLARYLDRWRSHERWTDISSHIEHGMRCDTSPIMLDQVMDVFISNAIKYSSAGSPIRVQVSRHDGNVRLEVADAGIGIAPQDLASLTVPFFRGREARQSGVSGTGLGLAIAQRIATALKGNLECTSQLGAGSRFALNIPLQAVGATTCRQNGDEAENGSPS
jgi:signal transduction histidine kinase